MLMRLIIAALGGPVVALLLFAAAWLFERITVLGAAIEGLLGTGVSIVAVWGLLSGVVYLVLYGWSRAPKG